MPRSSLSSDTLRFLAIEDLELYRPVVLYAVAGRQRSPAANGLMRLLRAANWEKLIGSAEAIPPARPTSSEPAAGVTGARPH
jgi:hypothetical protein